MLLYDCKKVVQIELKTTRIEKKNYDYYFFQFG